MRANKQRLCFGAKDMCNGFIAKPAYQASAPCTAPLTTTIDKIALWIWNGGSSV